MIQIQALRSVSLAFSAAAAIFLFAPITSVGEQLVVPINEEILPPANPDGTDSRDVRWSHSVTKMFRRSPTWGNDFRGYAATHFFVVYEKKEIDAKIVELNAIQVKTDAALRALSDANDALTKRLDDLEKRMK